MGNLNNVKLKVEGTILKIEIDISKRGNPTKTGKSITVAGTSGNIEVPGHPEIKLGINCYTPAGQ